MFEATPINLLEGNPQGRSRMASGLVSVTSEQLTEFVDRHLISTLTKPKRQEVERKLRDRLALAYGHFVDVVPEGSDGVHAFKGGMLAEIERRIAAAASVLGARYSLTPSPAENAASELRARGLGRARAENCSDTPISARELQGMLVGSGISYKLGKFVEAVHANDREAANRWIYGEHAAPPTDPAG